MPRLTVVVVSLQNGVGNTAVLRDRLPGRRVLGGMVPFNVIALGNGRFHRATSGDIVIEKDEARTAEQLSVPGLNDARQPTTSTACNGASSCSTSTTRSMRWPICRCAGNWRSGHGARLFADQVAEGLAAIRAEGIKPVSPTPIPMRLLPPLLRLPDPIFEALLGRTMKIDPEARSSMWEDLQRWPPHRGRLSAGRHHRDRRAARTGCAAVAPDCGVDPARPNMRPRVRPA